jgi:DNA primase
MPTRERIPDEFIEDVKSRSDLVSLIGEHVALKRSTRRYYGCCPFHDDSSPSFEVDPARGFFLCRGCGANGDAIKWLQQYEKLTFWEALRTLAQRAGIDLPRAEPRSAEDMADARIRSGISSALRQAASLYAYGLDHSSSARRYLDERGILPETAVSFGIGYVGTGIRSILANRIRDARSIIDAGIVNTNERGQEFELLRHRLTITIRNERGVVVGFAGRPILVNESSGPKYLNTPETRVFKKSRVLFGLDQAAMPIAHTRAVVVVEGYFDVISLHQAGEHRAVAGMGTSLSIEQADRLFRDADLVYLVLDGDKAGRAAAVRNAQVLLQRMRDGKEVRLVTLPDDQDPDEFIRSEGIATWQTVLAASPRLSDFIVHDLTSGVDSTVPESVVPMAVRAQEWLKLCELCPLYGRALRSALESRLGIALD